MNFGFFLTLPWYKHQNQITCYPYRKIPLHGHHDYKNPLLGAIALQLISGGGGGVSMALIISMNVQTFSPPTFVSSELRYNVSVLIGPGLTVGCLTPWYPLQGYPG